MIKSELVNLFVWLASSTTTNSSSLQVLVPGAMHRLCVIGSPRGAAEKFDAKRVIGSVFFWSGQVGAGYSGQPDRPVCYGNGIFSVEFPEIKKRCNF